MMRMSIAMRSITTRKETLHATHTSLLRPSLLDLERLWRLDIELSKRDLYSICFCGSAKRFVFLERIELGALFMFLMVMSLICMGITAIHLYEVRTEFKRGKTHFRLKRQNHKGIFRMESEVLRNPNGSNMKGKGEWQWGYGTEEVYGGHIIHSCDTPTHRRERGNIRSNFIGMIVKTNRAKRYFTNYQKDRWRTTYCSTAIQH